jgi:ribosomal protein S14
MKYKQILDKKKRSLFCMKEIKRLSLKIGIRLKYRLKLYSIANLSELLRNSSLSKIKNRCILTSRAKSVYKKIGTSRIKLRELVLNGIQFGIKKSTW